MGSFSQPPAATANKMKETQVSRLYHHSNKIRPSDKQTSGSSVNRLIRSQAPCIRSFKNRQTAESYYVGMELNCSHADPSSKGSGR